MLAALIEEFIGCLFKRILRENTKYDTWLPGYTGIECNEKTVFNICLTIIGLNNYIVSSAFFRLDKEAERMSLVVNDGKTKYLL